MEILALTVVYRSPAVPLPSRAAWAWLLQDRDGRRMSSQAIKSSSSSISALHGPAHRALPSVPEVERRLRDGEQGKGIIAVME